MSSVDDLHAKAVAEFVTKLRAAPAVAALVPEQVFGPGDAGAAEWGRAVVVTLGKKYALPAEGDAGKKFLIQLDAKVEIRAESEAVHKMLCNAVVKAMNGGVGKAFQHCIHTHSGHPDDAAGHWSRTDVFAMHCRHAADAPADRVVSVSGPPRRVPVAPPPRKPAIFNPPAETE